MSPRVAALVAVVVLVCSTFAAAHVRGAPAPHLQVPNALRLRPLKAGEPSHHMDFVAPETTFIAHFALHHDNVEAMTQLEELVDAVSTPGSPELGQYRSSAEVGELMQPSAASQEAVRQWLHDAGYTEEDIEWSPWRDHVVLKMTAAQFTAATSLGVQAVDTSTPHLTLAPSAASLPASHRAAPYVARVRIAGTLPRPAAAAASPQTLGMQAPNYPFAFWPPPAVWEADAAEFADGQVFFRNFVTCPVPNKWQTHTYPFDYNTVSAENLPGGTLEPCGPEYGQVQSYEVVLTDTAGHTQSAMYSLNENDVTFMDFSLLGNCAAGRCDVYVKSFPIVQFGVSGLQVQEGMPYTITINTRLALSQQVFTTQWVGNPDTTPIAVMKGKLKLPATVHSMYGVPANPVVCEAANRQSIGVLQPSASGFYSITDLDTFYTSAGIDTANAAQVQFVASASNNATLSSYLSSQGYDRVTIANQPSSPGLETTLDVQFISGIAPGARTMVLHGGYFVGLDNAGNLVDMDPMLTVLLALQYAATPPMVLSMSYGGPEPTSPALYEAHFMSLAVMGVTVIASSGDTGAYNPNPSLSAATTCANPGPSYPASSPYVTGVGATQMVGSQEVSASIATGCGITSGGGFSSVFSLPKWQRAAVTGYTANHPQPAARTGMRAVPDVAVVGNKFQIIYTGQKEPVDGTSASAPSFGGMVTLLNDQLLREGKPQLGYLNPKLYAAWGQHSSGAQSPFNDIMSGSNHCLGQDAPSLCCTFGYSAVAGYDPISGLGSPRFQQLSQALLNGTWVSGTCTVAQAACRLSCTKACSADGTCGTPLPDWAIALIILAILVVLMAGCAVCKRFSNKKPRRPRQDVPAATYVAMSATP